MSNQYIKKEVEKVLNSSNFEFPLNLAMGAAWIIANFKGVNIKVLDSRETSSLCDYNVIATAENTIQAKAMIDEFLRNLKKENEEALSLEGMQDAEWILLDLGDIIIHIFQDISREVFNLDGLWQELPSIDIPQEFYFSNTSEKESQQETAESYF